MARFSPRAVLTALLLSLVGVAAATATGVGKKRVLMLTHAEFGQSNVVLATAHSTLLQNKAGDVIDIHIASFPNLAPRVEWMTDTIKSDMKAAEANDRGRYKNMPSELTFHSLPFPSLKDALVAKNVTFTGFGHPPGFGMGKWAQTHMPTVLHPWQPEVQLQLYHALGKLIQSVKPDHIVVDSLFLPGLDAARDSGIEYLSLSPTTLFYAALEFQPQGRALWYYPSPLSGYPFPVKWYNIPANIAHVFFTFAHISLNREWPERKAFFDGHGLQITGPLKVYHSDVPMLVSTTTDVEYPMEFQPGMVPCGLITLPTEPFAEVDPETFKWVEQGKTVVIALGSHTEFGSSSGGIMLSVIERVLAARPDIQILWKFQSTKGSPGGLASKVSQLEATGRARIVPWMKVSPGTMIQHPNVVAYVNHAGGNSFNEAVALPQWADTYDIASRTEWLGIGLWANKKSAPNVNADELVAALLTVLDPANGFKDRAMKHVDKAGAEVGRERAARVIRRAVKEGNGPIMADRTGSISKDGAGSRSGSKEEL